MMETDSQPLISIRDLKVHFPLPSGSLFRRSRQVVQAVDGASREVQMGIGGPVDVGLELGQ